MGTEGERATDRGAMLTGEFKSHQKVYRNRLPAPGVLFCWAAADGRLTQEYFFISHSSLGRSSIPGGCVLTADRPAAVPTSDEKVKKGCRFRVSLDTYLLSFCVENRVTSRVGHTRLCQCLSVFLAFLLTLWMEHTKNFRSVKTCRIKITSFKGRSRWSALLLGDST